MLHSSRVTLAGQAQERGLQCVSVTQSRDKGSEPGMHGLTPSHLSYEPSKLIQKIHDLKMTFYDCG